MPDGQRPRPSKVCTCTPMFSPSVIGACARDLHGMKALRVALGAMVDLYRDPSGRLLVEPGASPEDDALTIAIAALGE